MSTLSTTHLAFAPRSRRSLARRRPTTRGLWREIGIGLGVGLLGLILTAFAITAGGDRSAGPIPTPPAHTTTTTSFAPAIFAPGAVPTP